MTAERRWPIIDTHHHIGVSPTCTFIAEDDLLPWMEAGQVDIQVDSRSTRAPATGPLTGTPTSE
jgi:hypothetical protein